MRKNEFAPENYDKVEVKWNLGFLKASLYGVIIYIVAGVILGIPFMLVNTDIVQEFRYDFLGAWGDSALPFHILMPGLVLTVIVHELLHAFFYAIQCKHGFKSIKFGVEAKSFMFYAYAACKEIIPTSKFIAGLVLPGIITGIMPVIASIFIGSLELFFFGLLITSMCVGDLYILSQIYKNRKSTWFHNTAWLEPNAEYDMVLYKPK